MSLILDALRKSEAERRRGALPALTLELPPAQGRPRRPRAGWLAVLPLLLLGTGAAAWFLRPAAAPAPGENAPVGATRMPAGVEPVPAPVALPSPPPREQDPATTVPAAPPAAPETTPAAPAPAPLADAPQFPVDTPAGTPVLALSDLTAAERNALPPLKLSMHLWSEDPARRFVILDGHRLGEGDRAGVAVVERIEPAGVILAADGRRIRLPLP